MRRSRWAAVALLVVVLAASCGRSKGQRETGTGATQTTAAGAAGGGRFGDLNGVCKSGDAKGATDVGVSDAEIRLATFTDKGAAIKPGLTKEMYDAAVAFSKWCNEQGGILGRKLVVDGRDAKLTEYNARVLESCGTDLAMVGGGAVFDDADNGERVRCGLVNIAGYVVSPKARAATLQVQPVPNPVYQLPVGAYRSVQRQFPSVTQNFGIMSVAFPSTKVVKEQKLEAVAQLGWKAVFNADYNATGESDWRPFVERLKSANVKVLEFVGEPENLTQLQKAMDTVGFYPDVIIQEANFYDQKFVDEGGSVARNTWVRTQFHPLELAKDNKGTQDYLDIMKRYNPSGKIAQLGVQAFSSWLLFAQAATECGSQLTRACLLQKAQAVTSWTGGGLHGADNPARNTPSPCVAVLKAGPGKWTYDRGMTQPNQGIFNCDPANVVDLKADYGVPRPAG